MHFGFRDVDEYVSFRPTQQGRSALVLSGLSAEQREALTGPLEEEFVLLRRRLRAPGRRSRAAVASQSCLLDTMRVGDGADREVQGLSGEPEVGFDYITKPTNWTEFWPDLVDIPDLEQTRWQEPGDTARLQMKLAGRLTELHMTLDELSRPALVRYHSTQQGVPDAAHERHFEPAAGGFDTASSSAFEPRPGFAGSSTGPSSATPRRARCARRSTTWRSDSLAR